jgi:putative membrane protein
MNTNLPRFLRGCSALAVAASLTAVLAAQTDNALPTPTPTPTEANDTTSTHAERAFMKKAAKAGMKEIAISQAVLDHLANPQLKEFARQMITDHTNANNQLLALAQQKGVEIPPKDEASLTEGWSEKTGDVDRKYIDVMVSDHEEAVKLFEKASQSSDADVAAFAQKTLPVIQHHLQMAKDLKASIQ